jgi:hypothetical protein
MSPTSGEVVQPAGRGVLVAEGEGADQARERGCAKGVVHALQARSWQRSERRMATFLKIFVAVLLVVLLAHAVIGWLRPDVMPGLSFLPGDIKYESPSGNVRVYFPVVTSIVLSLMLSLILSLLARFFGR